MTPDVFAVRIAPTIARFNRMLVNPLALHLARHGPRRLGVVVHRGRVSGEARRTPVVAHDGGDSVVVALTYGQGADWVRNVLAAGGCTLEIAGRQLALTRPEVLRHERPPAAVTGPARAGLRLLRVKEYLELAIEDPEQS